jgi:hypothetical protein
MAEAGLAAKLRDFRSGAFRIRPWSGIALVGNLYGCAFAAEG